MSRETLPLPPLNAAELHTALLGLTEPTSRFTNSKGETVIPCLVASINEPMGQVTNPYLLFSSANPEPTTTIQRIEDGEFLIQDTYPPAYRDDVQEVAFNYRCRFYGRDYIEVAEHAGDWRYLEEDSPAMVHLLARFIHLSAHERSLEAHKEGVFKRFIGKIVDSLGKIA